MQSQKKHNKPKTGEKKPLPKESRYTSAYKKAVSYGEKGYSLGLDLPLNSLTIDMLCITPLSRPLGRDLEPVRAGELYFDGYGYSRYEPDGGIALVIGALLFGGTIDLVLLPLRAVVGTAGLLTGAGVGFFSRPTKAIIEKNNEKKDELLSPKR